MQQQPADRDSDEYSECLFDIKEGANLSDPIGTVEEKWKLIPAFLKLKGLVKQHLDSYDYFIEKDLAKIVAANSRVDSDIDPTFYLRYTGIRVGMPNVEEDLVSTAITPQECRLRDVTYAANLSVDIEYIRGKQIVQRKDVIIGR